MTDQTLTTIAGDSGIGGVVADLAARLGARHVIDLVPGAKVGVILEDGQELHEIDLESFGPNPDRKQGHPTFDDPDSFAGYVGRHADRYATTLWGSITGKRITAVLDDHAVDHLPAATADGEPAGPTVVSSLAGWGQHRATLNLRTTPDWDRWLKHDGQWMDQVEFAEHIEDGANIIVQPDAADMLELAQSFQAAAKVDFKSGQRLQSGETQLRFEETIDARAGVNGSITIPEFIVLSVEPFEGAPKYQLQARFRYRIAAGGVKLSYRLVRPEEAQRLAFVDVLAYLETKTGLTVMQGTPRP